MRRPPLAPRIDRDGLRRRSRAALAVLAALLLALALDMAQLWSDTRFNRALRSEDWAAAAAHDSAHGRLAAAYRLQRSGQVDEAVALYGEVGSHDGAELHRIARYNMAGIYLEQAQRLTVDNEQRVPLVELAKQLYREVLREQPQHWDARYNLSRALALAPDAEPEDIGEERNPERAPRAPRANPAYEQLP